MAEDVLATRALDGVEEEIFYRGELIGTPAATTAACCSRT
jgi:hypothetical protein